MSGFTTPELTGIVMRLAVNYSRKFESDEDLMLLVHDWAEQLDTYDLADIELARKGMMGDPQVRYFPPISDFRKRVQLARADRRRDDGTGTGCAACVGSGGTVGWAPAGTDDDGYEYVDHCPNGCKPPPAHHHPDVVRQARRRRQHAGQQVIDVDEVPPEARAALQVSIVKELDF